MAEVLGFTPRGVAIAGWMVQANPDVFDVGTAIAETDGDGWDEEWRWSCRETYRLDLIAEGQPVFMWITRNPNPHLGSGIWLAGRVTSEPRAESASGSLLWRDRAAQEAAEWFLPMKVAPLKRFVPREELLAHPVLRDLEVLRSPQMSNPQIVTSTQLDALRSDFDLSTAPLQRNLRKEILAFESARPPLAARGAAHPDQTGVELVLGSADGENEFTVHQEAGRWIVTDLSGLVDSRAERWSAFELAIEKATDPVTVDAGSSPWDGQEEIALLFSGGETWVITAAGNDRYSAAPEGHDPQVSFDSLTEAMKHATEQLNGS